MAIFATQPDGCSTVLAKRWLAGDPFGAAASQMLGGGVAALAMGQALGERLPERVSA